MNQSPSIHDRANALSHTIIGAAIEVHRALGPGLLESAYETCLLFELSNRGLKVERQKDLPIVYKSIRLESGYRMDLVVENLIIVELKAIEAVLPVHRQQLLSYLKLARMPLGLLINFHTPLLKDGIDRIINSSL